ncbi:Na(+)-translocating NADH-quinone reductase subunit C [Candidatus Enterovibrio escicola]|uniref:Na(+)-translocating NADH-quinone reductase subunit C n=1 Tax=Candidatus Enterovibrio escicola TaxID=1927127 RepID=UPI001237D795|nr:Na(+)-translocating NADH-quinone reductase subunit C [Candidatus Enterovibrio escacola]
MSSNNDSVKKILTVVVTLSLVCSVVVSFTVVSLRSLQEKNVALDEQRNILSVAGIDDDGDIQTAFEEYIEPQLIDLSTGDMVGTLEEAREYNQRLAANNLEKSILLSSNVDVVGIGRQAKLAKIYLVKNDRGETRDIILPIHGNGLWSMMYAFIAVKTDGNTVGGISYYQQGETPGLGGEVENPRWRSQWVGKKLFDDEGKPAIHIVKGGARLGDIHGIDGLSGATLTSNGVQRTFDFWLSTNGFGPFLAKVREGGLKNG